jgi:hypothetical protein
MMTVQDFGGAFIEAAKLSATYVGAQRERPMCGYTYSAVLSAAVKSGFYKPTPHLVESIGEYACTRTTARRRRRILADAELQFFGSKLVDSTVRDRLSRPGMREAVLHRAFELLSEQTVAMVFSLQPAKLR